MTRGVPAVYSVFPMTFRGETVYRAVKELPRVEGKRRRATGTGRTEREAVQRMEASLRRYMTPEARTEALSAAQQARSGPTVAEWVKEWHRSLNPDRVSDTVRRKYLRLAEQHIAPHLGSKRLRQVTKQDVHLLIHTTLPGMRKPDGTRVLNSGGVINVHKVLNLLMTKALHEEKIDRNPCLGVDRPQREWRDEKVQERTEDAKTIASIVATNPQVMLMFLGLRKSEKLAIEWKSITGLNSDEPGTIEIKQQLARSEYGDGLYIKKRTKTKSSTRTLPLVDPWRAALRAHKKIQDGWKASTDWNPPKGMDDLVFTTPTGAPISHNADNAGWHALLEELEIPYFRPHLMRHITATMLADNGVGVDVARQILGHNSEAMTAYYTHAGTQRAIIPVSGLLAFTNPI